MRMAGILPRFADRVPLAKGAPALVAASYDRDRLVQPLRHWFVAVWLTLVSAPGQNDLREQINHALDQARPALLDHLRAATHENTRIGELALLLLAAIHDGVDAEDPALVAAVKRLAKAKPDDTYDLALRLLVLEASPTFPDRLELASRDTKELLRHRDTRGGFHYQANANTWDLSNTQYAALGLRAAKALGVPIERSIWLKMAQEIGAQQDSYGGFAYQSRNRGFDPGGYASMTAAGIAVLAICRQALDSDNSDAELDKKITRGWQWFDRNVTTIGSAQERWAFYFHYGLERAAILTDTTTVGKVDWYAKGASMLVDAQLPGGGWVSRTDGYMGSELGRGRGNSVPVAFAVLFLRRKFQKVLGPTTPHVVTLAAVGPMSKQKDVDACTAELVRRGKEAMPDLLKALRSECEQQRRAAAGALVAIAGEGFGYDPAKDEDKNREAVRRAELWHLRHR